MWTMSKDGFIMRPKLKLQGSSLARVTLTLMRKVPLGVPAFIKFKLHIELDSHYITTQKIL